jgi:uncharacterized protein
VLIISIMERKLLVNLREWRAHPKRKPLVLSGVRQCGKTYLLKTFGERYFSRCHYINFEKDQAAHQMFAGDLSPQKIIESLGFYLQTTIDAKDDLLIFDEIQACPNALTSLKYFCEELPEQALCSAGSLLGLNLATVSFPVGKVDLMHLYPLTFQEFLAGIDDQQSLNFINSFDFKRDIPEVIHQHLFKQFKKYTVVGGLPEVVTVFDENKNNLYAAMEAAREKQRELFKEYYADIAKHSGKVNAMHIDRVWRSVPIQLARNQDSSAPKFKFKGVVPNVDRYSRLANVLDWLVATDLVTKNFIVEKPRIPLMAFSKENVFKLFMFDIGLLGAMANLAPKTLLDYDYGSYKGYIAENFVANQLLSSGYSNLYSWHQGKYELEFLIETGQGDIVPIEVKAGAVTKAQSLRNYIDKYQPSKAIKLTGRTFHAQGKGRYHVPLYLAGHLKPLLETDSF